MPGKMKRIFRLTPASVVVIMIVFFCVLCYRLWKDRTEVLPAGTLQVHFIDVGNADSILLMCGGKTMLIDAGENNDGDRVVNYIHSQNVRKLDYVIATHPDSDHIGGMDTVVNEIPVGIFIMPIMPDESTPTTKTYLDLLEALDRKGIEITLPEPGMNFFLNEAKAEILGPVGTFDNNNNMSVICKVTNGVNRFLFMGDAESIAESALLGTNADIRADFLKIGHHGSNTSSKDALLDAVSPRYAVIMCGEGNSYGHPHADTVKRLKNHNTTVFRSDINGNIIVTSDGETLKIMTQRQ